ncbi:hypothetical protein TSUD_315250 [Trifolium subterraneum]|uniref:Uncharacterized protein n=1 Tax=Trifolium subterraneum TaxID=3900 RepID=A0A2Z6MEZ8_TRISU|nr:hypothetical protein TSUD_315250 [Trifolium subterraneum]
MGSFDIQQLGVTFNVRKSGVDNVLPINLFLYNVIALEHGGNALSDGNVGQNLTNESIVQQNDVLVQDLDVAREQLEVLSKQYGELEAKSKADIKVLVKEVKYLHSSQKELKKEFSESIKEKCDAEVVSVHMFHTIFFLLAVHTKLCPLEV